MPTNFSPLLSVTSISSGLNIPSEDKKRLPPPEILSEPYDCEGMLCVDIKDHLGRHWSIAALKRAHLRRKLRYFKSLPREVINRLLPTPPGKLLAQASLPKRKSQLTKSQYPG